MMTGMGFGMIFMLFFWVALVALIVWAVGLVTNRGFGNPENRSSRTPLEIAAERYARGEIDRAQFELIKKDLKQD